MKKFALLSILICVFSIQTLFSQTYVSTDSQDKNVILEEFTGVNCPNCPQGHVVANQILEDHPGRAWVVGFHPFNSNYTTPGAGQPDFRRHHADSLYMTPYCGSSRFMPSAFINRRVYNNERIQSRTVWANYTNQFLAEASPVNVGLATSYDETTKQLDILVEIYYTDDMTDLNTLNVLFSESGMVAYQSGGSANYIHKHVFRETFTAQWGDPISQQTTQGTFIQNTFTFDNSAEEYDMAECEVLAYVVNSATTEIISGIGCHVGDNTNLSEPIADFSVDNEYIPVGESANMTDLSTGGPETWAWVFEGGTPSSSDLQEPPPVFYNEAGTYEVSLSVTNANGSSTETKTDYIVTGYPPVAGYSFIAELNSDETIINFTDESSNNPAAWEWTFDGGTPGTSTDQNPTGISYTIPGYYDISLIASNDFGVNTYMETIYVDVISNISQTTEDYFEVYPNPSSGIFNIEQSSSTAKNIWVYDARGSLVVHHKNLWNKSLTIDLSEFDKGIYLLKVETEDKSFSKRIILSD